MRSGGAKALIARSGAPHSPGIIYTAKERETIARKRAGIGVFS